MDGKLIEIPREEALELLPFQEIFRSPVLKAPIEGIMTHKGKLIPVLGPLPLHDTKETHSSDYKPWILLLEGCAQVIQGLPEFIETEKMKQSPSLRLASENATLDALVSSLEKVA